MPITMDQLLCYIGHFADLHPICAYTIMLNIQNELLNNTKIGLISLDV